MKRLIAVVLGLLLVFVPAALVCAEAAADSSDNGPAEGFRITDEGIDITLFENGSTGYQWEYELDDDDILSYISDDLAASEDATPGAGVMHTWRFKAGEDGEALLSFYYERPWETGYDDEDGFGDESEDDWSDEEDWANEDDWSDEEDWFDGDDIAPARAIDFTVSVVDGKVIFCEQQDYSDDDNQGDYDDYVVPYQGETGGVEIEVPADMAETQTDEGTLLSSSDGMSTILINYEPDDDAEALFEQLKDDQSAAAIYDDEDAGVKVTSCTVDREADIPSVTMVYYIKDGIAEYTGYKAPQGGVLHVHTTYLLGEDIDDWEDEPDDTPPEDSADGTVG